MKFDENTYCYLNGRILKIKDAKISPFDLGFTRGYAVTEVLRAYNGKIFLFNEHWLRLKKAVKALRLNLKETKKEVKDIMLKLMNKNKCMNANIKLVLSPGVGKTDLDIGENETLFLYAQEYTDYPKNCYNKGVKLMSVDFKRNLSEVKSSDYIQAVCLRNQLKKQKAFEILYILNGYVTECSTSNIFMIKKGVLITPKKDVLFGITRNFVISFASKAMKVIEKDVKINDLLKADEVFITATSKQIMPVTKINEHIISDGKVGKNTKMLQGLFVENRDKYIGID